MIDRKKYSLEGNASFKQGWKIAHMFAEQLADDYPQYDHRKLAHLINGTIFYYHQSKETPMSKLEASEIISNDLKCPNYYVDNLNSFLANPNKKFKKIKSPQANDDGKDPDLDLLIEIARQGE